MSIGGLCAWWKLKFGICEEIDTTYGTTPNAATFDDKFWEKRLKAHDSGKFQVFEGNSNQKVVNYSNFIKVLQEEIKVCCGLWSGAEPHALHCNFFEWFVIEKGHVAGTPAFKLKKMHLGQKEKAFTLKNHTKKEHLSHVNHLHIIINKGALFYLYTMLKLHIDVFMPPQHLFLEDCRFIFQKEASQPQIAVSSICFCLICCYNRDVCCC